jgi:hypothetical protein
MSLSCIGYTVVVVSLGIVQEAKTMWVPTYDWLSEALRRDPLSHDVGYADIGSLMLYLIQLCEKVDYRPLFYVSLFDKDESLVKSLGSMSGFISSDRTDVLHRGWVRFYFDGTDCYCVVRPNAKSPRTARVRNKEGRVIGKAVILTSGG